MDGKVNCPPFRLSRLFLVAEEFIVGSAQVVAGDAVADGPASRSVHVILDDELFRITAFFAAARDVALHATVIHKSNQIKLTVDLVGLLQLER